MRTGQIEIAEYDGQIRGQMNLSDFAEEGHSRRSPPGSRRKLRQRPSGSRTFQPALLLI